MSIFMYVYKQTKDDGEELKYSIRSLEANFIDRQRIVVVGDKPSWFVAGDHIPVEHTNDKFRNIQQKVMVGLHALYGERVVYYMEDDYFLLDPTNNIQLCHWGRLDMHVDKVVEYHGEEREYSKQMRATEMYLNDVNAKSFELHRPTPVIPESTLPVLTEHYKSIDPTEPMGLWKTVWGNRSGLHSWQARDGREGSSVKHGVPWISSADNAGRGWGGKSSTRRVVRDLFQTPSSFER